MALVLADYEDVKARSILRESAYGYVFERTYNVPPQALSVIPSRGTILVLKSGDPASDSEGAIACLKCRVQEASYNPRKTDAAKLVRIAAILPKAYSAVSKTSYQEVRGSRPEYDAIAGEGATVIGVSTDGANGPTIGAFYPPDSALGVLGRRCVNVTVDQTTVPGLYYIVAAYDVARNRRTGSHAWGDTFVYEYMIAAGVDPPVRGDLATVDESGVLGRRITSVACVEQDASIPTRLTVTVAQPVSFTGATGDTYRELRGSRRERGGGRRRYAYTVGVSTDGTGGPSDGDTFAGDTGLLGRRCNLIETDRQTLPGLYLIRATYMAYMPVDPAATGNSIEIKGPTLRRRGLNNYHGQRTFLCKDTNAITQQQALYGTSYPALPGGASSKCFDPRVTYNPDGLEGVALITANYSPPGAEILPAGQARLYMQSIDKRVRRKYSNDGVMMEGTVEGSDGADKWVIVRGSPEAIHHRIRYKIVGFISRNKIAAFEASIAANYDLVNGSAFARPSAAAGTLKLAGIGKIESYADVNIPVSVILDYNRNGWKNSITSSEEAFVVRSRKVQGTEISRTFGLWEPNRHVDAAGAVTTVAEVTHNIVSTGNLGFIKTAFVIVD